MFYHTKIEEINENDEFFEQLLHISEMTQEEALDMNSALEQLLNKMGDFYQKPEYELDLNRAMMLFTDPDMPEDEKTNREFWYSFWEKVWAKVYSVQRSMWMW